MGEEGMREGREEEGREGGRKGGRRKGGRKEGEEEGREGGRGRGREEEMNMHCGGCLCMCSSLVGELVHAYTCRSWCCCCYALII